MKRFELESFSGRLAGDIKRDFHAMMSNMLAGSLREARRKAAQAAGSKEWKYACRTC